MVNFKKIFKQLKKEKGEKETLSLSLDFSNAFDKLWHDDLIFKLKQCRILGSLLKRMKGFLTDYPQRLMLKGQNFSGVSQEPFLGPLISNSYVKRK